MKFLNFDRVLCLSPHPDDVEYGMLGSICKFKDTTFDILTTSIGGNFDKSSGESRFRECEKVWELLKKSYFIKINIIIMKSD